MFARCFFEISSIQKSKVMEHTCKATSEKERMESNNSEWNCEIIDETILND